MASVLCHKKYIARIACTIRQIMILQGLQVLLFISIINFRLLKPILWLQTIFNKTTSGVCWLCYILNALILFGLIVRYSKNYTVKYLLISSRFDKIIKLFSTNGQILILVSIVFGFTNAYFHLNLTGIPEIIDDQVEDSLSTNYSLVLCSGPFFALFYFLKHNFKDEIIQLPVIHQSIKMQLAYKFNVLIYNAAKLTIQSIPIYFVTYSIVGYKAIEVSRIIFDTENNFEINYLEINLIIYLFVFGTSFYLTLLVMHELFILNLMQPMEFPIDEENNTDDLLLKDALKSEIPLIKLLAFQDLYILTERVPERRREMFAITFPGGQGKNWNEITGECISVLDKFISGLMKTYPKISSSKINIDYNNLPNRRVNLDHMLGSFEFRAYPKEVLNNQDIVAEAKPTFKENMIKQIINNRFFIYLFGNKNLLEFKQVIAQSQIIIWVNLSLTMLLKMSLAEDQYGVTQNDIPKILELMLKLQDTLNIVNKMTIYKMLVEKDDSYITLTSSLEVNIRSCLYILNHIYGPYFAKMKLNDSVQQKLAHYNL